MYHVMISKLGRPHLHRTRPVSSLQALCNALDYPGLDAEKIQEDLDEQGYYLGDHGNNRIVILQGEPS